MHYRVMHFIYGFAGTRSMNVPSQSGVLKHRNGWDTSNTTLSTKGNDARKRFLQDHGRGGPNRVLTVIPYNPLRMQHNPFHSYVKQTVPTKTQQRGVIIPNSIELDVVEDSRNSRIVNRGKGQETIRMNTFHRFV